MRCNHSATKELPKLVFLVWNLLFQCAFEHVGVALRQALKNGNPSFTFHHESKPEAQSWTNFILRTSNNWNLNESVCSTAVTLSNCLCLAGDFLKTLQDGDINVRRVALVMFNSAAHNKPSLIRGLLATVLPHLYKETQIRKDLIREVGLEAGNVHIWCL